MTIPCPQCGSISNNWHPESNACYDCDYSVVAKLTPLILALSFNRGQRTRADLHAAGMTDDQIAEQLIAIEKHERENPTPYPIPNPPEGFQWSADNSPAYKGPVAGQIKGVSFPKTLGYENEK